MDHCCNLMDEFLEENKVSIGYSERFRSYYIELKTSKSATQDIYYCPWCGKKLPKILDDEYDQELSKATGIAIDNITLDTYSSSNPNLPPEFRTDEWWKKRGL
jgi:hypothetical protein